MNTPTINLVPTAEGVSICDRCAFPLEQHGSFNHGNPCPARDTSGLTVQLLHLEGMRVQVTTDYGDTRRFWVGRSTGWRPCHIEVLRRDSTGGIGADSHYQTVTVVDRGPRR